MSYFAKDSGDSVNNLFSRLADLNMTSKHLLEANDEMSFRVWLEKCIQIDKRSTFLFIKKNRDKIKYLELVSVYFSEDLYGKI